MWKKIHTKTHKNIAAQTHFACDKTHYALETKLEMSGIGYILVGIFAGKIRSQMIKKPSKQAFLF